VVAYTTTVDVTQRRWYLEGDLLGE